MFKKHYLLFLSPILRAIVTSIKRVRIKQCISWRQLELKIRSSQSGTYIKIRKTEKAVSGKLQLKLQSGSPKHWGLVLMFFWWGGEDVFILRA